MSRSILKNSSKIGGLSLVSRVIAFLREFLLIRFLSIGEQSDLFFAAFRVPNTLRKIFAEGLLSSILIPAIVSADHKGGKKRANKLTTLAFIQIESLIAIFCLIIYWKSEFVISIIVPGFGKEKIIASAHLLKILISFILFISSGAIFAAALQAHKKFFIPALAPAILNVLYVVTLATCLFNDCSLSTFSFGMLTTSVGYFILHIAAYLYLQFKFAKPTAETWDDFKLAVIQFIPCFISSGILEINHFVNTMFASYLQSGSLTLIRTSYQFVNIPVGIIAASLSTVLLPHFSKLHLEKSKDIGKHVLEAVKFTLWAILPICFLLYFFSKEIFETLFMGDAQAMSKIPMAQSIFSAYLIGLFAFALNKIFLSIFYAMRLSFVPMIATLISILVNFTLSRLLMGTYKAAGIAFASSASSITQTFFS